MNIISHISRLVLLMGIPFILNGQVPESYSKGKLKRIAEAAIRLNDNYTAIDYYEALLEKDQNNLKANYKLAGLYRDIRDYDKALEAYVMVYMQKPDKYPLSLFYLAEMERTLGNTKGAAEHYETFRKAYKKGKDSKKFRRLAKFAIAGIEQGLHKNDTQRAVISHMDNSINKAHIESSPFFIGENKMIYSSLKEDAVPYVNVDELDKRPKRQFYQAVREGSQWKSMGLWNDVINQEEIDISSGAFSPDGDNFYFTKCEISSVGKNHCEIWISRKIDGKWEMAEKLPQGINHPMYTSTQPTVGTDNKGREVLYFVSDRKGGKGGMDIWYSQYNPRRDEYRNPRNSGSKVNSVGDELTPYFHPLNRSLYFSSNGHPGVGGLDVFKSIGERSRWTEPEVLGLPVNSTADDLYFVVSRSGEEGFLASNRTGGTSIKHANCCDDLYYFIYPDHVSIQLNLELVNKVNTNETLDGAIMEILRPQEGEEEPILIQQIMSDRSGKITTPIEAGYSYIIRVKKKGYLLEELDYSTENSIVSEEVNMRLEIEPLPKTAIVVKNVYYEYNKSDLSDEVQANIDQYIYKLLRDNPEIVIEISSHTDSKGTEGYNRNLSQRRAEEVVKYLRKKGIDRKRMKAKGYGESVPIAENENPDGSDNPEGRAQNRRTEIKVIGTVDVEVDDGFDD